MSWDIIAQDLPGNAISVQDIPDDFKPQAIGDRDELIAKIREVVPEADFSNPSWGIIDGDDWSIEVSIAEQNNCGSIAFHVRGGDGAVAVVAAILNKVQLRALDCQAGEFFTGGAESLDSFRAWRRYRDRVVGGNGTSA
jgi:hypothetical protein